MRSQNTEAPHGHYPDHPALLIVLFWIAVYLRTPDLLQASTTTSPGNITEYLFLAITYLLLQAFKAGQVSLVIWMALQILDPTTRKYLVEAICMVVPVEQYSKLIQPWFIANTVVKAVRHKR